MIYLNNAATSYPKPACVQEAVERAVREIPTGQFRDSGGNNGKDLLSQCRSHLGRILGIRETERICFTSGSTESLNLIFLGLGIPADQIITTVTEHNSVLRPLYNLPGIQGKPVLLPCDENGRVSPELFEREAAKGCARAVVLNHCSNVTGAVQDAGAFGKIAKKYGLLFILDVSQSAGCIPVDVDAWQVDAAAFTGHKSLLGIMGTGGFYIRSGIPFAPYRYGGTGRESSRLLAGNEGFGWDTGTQNIPGIAALAVSSEWILKEGTHRIKEKEHSLMIKIHSDLKEIPGIRIFGDPCGNTGPVVSFQAEHLEPSDLGYILNSAYGIVVRTGLHCSPLIHSYIGSGEKGTVRISFSPFTVPEEIDALTKALREIL